ncbi:MAG TPA: hypothetical protein VIX86_04625 [Streptosporangiaceae bacterium]
MTEGKGNGVQLAFAIILFWLAGLAFFIAFEGSGILGETVPASGSGGASYFRAVIQGLRNIVAPGSSGTPAGAGVGSAGPVTAAPSGITPAGSGWRGA